MSSHCLGGELIHFPCAASVDKPHRGRGSFCKEGEDVCFILELWRVCHQCELGTARRLFPKAPWRILHLLNQDILQWINETCWEPVGEVAREPQQSYKESRGTPANQVNVSPQKLGLESWLAGLGVPILLFCWNILLCSICISPFSTIRNTEHYLRILFYFNICWYCWLGFVFLSCSPSFVFLNFNSPPRDLYFLKFILKNFDKILTIFFFPKELNFSLQKANQTWMMQKKKSPTSWSSLFCLL